MAASAVSFAFQNKIVIVTGGNSGIGAETVAGFLKGGAKVAVLDIRPSSDVVASEQRMDVTCDIGVEAEAEAAVAQVVEKWGRVDILCNVAGIMDAMDRVSEASTSLWERCFKVNVNGPFYLMRACVKHFLSKPLTEPVTTRGSIVNVGSLASKSGACAGTAYTASKHAILGLSRSTAWMYAKEGIRCNIVLPGGVQTNIMANSGTAEQIQTAPGMAAVWPFNKLMPSMVEAADVARTILFLAGTEGINGAEVGVDAGWSTT